MSSSSNSSLPHTPIDNLQKEVFRLNQTESSIKIAQSKTLLVLFAWFGALERHLDKYRQLYLDKDYDVFSIRGSLTGVLIPSGGAKLIAVQLLEYLSEHYHQYDSIILHSFSMGSYQMGELLVLLEQKEHIDINSKLRPLIKGVIYDSPVDIDWIDIGIANTITSNPLLQWIIMSLVKGYLSLFHNIAAKHYIIASAIQHKNPHKYPILMFFSKDDVATNWEHMCGVIERWREDGISVWFKCWDRSLHVSHYYKHPREYVEKVDEFLHEIHSEHPGYNTKSIL